MGEELSEKKGMKRVSVVTQFETMNWEVVRNEEKRSESKFL